MRHDEILEALILQFRRGLVLRRSGKLEEAQAILENTVPAEIRRWSQANTGQRSEEKKAKLRDVFQKELGRVEDAFLVYELLAERIEQDIIPALVNQVAVQLHGILSQHFAEIPATIVHVPVAGSHEPTRVVDPLVEKLGRPLPRSPERVSFDDIPGMIDMLLEKEYEQRHPEL